jgi:hypothetical protein
MGSISTIYGRGTGVGRSLGVGAILGVGVGRGVEVGVGVKVAVAASAAAASPRLTVDSLADRVRWIVLSSRRCPFAARRKNFF